MPTSNLWCAPYLVELVYRTGVQGRVLDVGPGHGKFSTLLREYCPGVTAVDAVEAWEPYVEQFNLKGLYDDVIVGDATELPDDVLARYDLVFMSEVIEHMELATGQAFLDRVPGKVALSTPTQWFQEDHEVPTERHRSLWTVYHFPAARIHEHFEALGGLFVSLHPKAGAGG